MQLPLNVSPVSASFIGLVRLGIHLVLVLACVAPALAPLLTRRVSGGTNGTHARGCVRMMGVPASLVTSLALSKIEVSIHYAVVQSALVAFARILCHTLARLSILFGAVLEQNSEIRKDLFSKMWKL